MDIFVHLWYVELFLGVHDGSGIPFQTTIIDRIERLRAEGRTNNYIFFNSKRHAVLATWKAQLGKEGLPVPSEPPDMTKLKESRGARVVMIAVETGAGSFLEALQ